MMASVIIAIHSSSLRKALTAILKNNGHNVVDCASVDDFVKTYNKNLRSRPFQVAVVDLKLPLKESYYIGKKNIRGLELIQKIINRDDYSFRFNDYSTQTTNTKFKSIQYIIIGMLKRTFKPLYTRFILNNSEIPTDVEDQKKKPSLPLKVYNLINLSFNTLKNILYNIFIRKIKTIFIPVYTRFILIDAEFPTIIEEQSKNKIKYLKVIKSIQLPKTILTKVNEAQNNFWVERGKKAKKIWWMLVPFVLFLILNDLIRGISFSCLSISIIGIMCLFLIYLAEIRICRPERNISKK